MKMAALATEAKSMDGEKAQAGECGSLGSQVK